MAKSLQRLCRETLPLMLKETSGREILDAVEEVQTTDRWNSFDRFHDTTEALVRRYEAAGARAGGRQYYYNWISLGVRLRARPPRRFNTL